MATHFLTGAAAALFVALAVGAPRTQDAEKGKADFAACAPCHAPDKNGIGPKIGGVVGRKAGTAPGFRYSRAMRSAGIVWDVKSLDAYLSNPQAFIPGNLMPFSGIAEADKRADIIGYLETLH